MSAFTRVTNLRVSHEPNAPSKVEWYLSKSKQGVFELVGEW
jgi:hypothetical protein